MENLSLRSISGIGEYTEKYLLSIGIRAPLDLLNFKPKGYLDLRKERLLSDATIEDPSILCKIHIISKSEIKDGKGTLKIMAEDDNGDSLALLCFNRPFLNNVLLVGSSHFIYSAKVSKYRGQYSASNFEIKKRPEDLGFGSIVALYSIKKPLTARILKNAISSSLSLLSPIADPLPPHLYTSLNLLHHEDALRLLHFPKTPEDAEKALKTLSFTEIFLLLLKAKRRPDKKRVEKGIISEKEMSLLSILPFSLTEDQCKAIEEIRKDLDSPLPMNRVLEGDVGSGKTLVSYLAALHVIEKNEQVAYLAPTELLAAQQYQSALSLLSPLSVSVSFLSSEVVTKERGRVLEDLKKGKIDLLIGTHSLFSKDVNFKNLSLAIIDEEHRFGVRQRDEMKKKGENIDVLSMSATPIPRTIALTMYADSDISVIRTMPKGRLPVITYLVNENKREYMYNTIATEFKRGHQAYFVFPRISEEGKRDLRSVSEMYKTLKSLYPDIPSAYLHSHVSDEEKVKILNDFKEKKLMYIVSTSVVEVGIDVKDATCMVIEHADTYGLASLHQLRGRVGRSLLQSYCFLVFPPFLTDDAKERLRAMKESNDGFAIAEKDLAIRGPGEIFGEKQSGFLKLNFSTLSSSSNLVEIATEEVDKILSETSV